MALARHALVARYGEPRSASGAVQPLVVIAMGKLGGGELNFSSDVDLVLLFPEHGETDGTRSIANEEFFTRLGQGLVRLLGTATADGFVLRVDLRLRPFGDSGPLVASFAAFEDYLPRHGRDWERYAYVKARAVTGPERYAELEAAAVRPFVYRRYLDYGVFESLREMKALIEREVERRELADDVKLGPGGIREIEFIVQALQLTRGGRDRRLQTPSLLPALERLGETQLLPPAAVAELRAAYLFLRRLENRLQMLGDAQVHQLPAEPRARERIAHAMGCADWPALLAALQEQRATVQSHFRQVIFGGAAGDASAVRIDLGRFWDTQAETAALGAALAPPALPRARRRRDCCSSCAPRRWCASSMSRGAGGCRRCCRRCSPTSPERRAAAGAAPDPRHHRGDRQALGLFRTAARECPGARAPGRAVRHGEFLVAQIAAHPLLLDELIDARLLSERRARRVARDLEERMGQLREEDPERQVEALCHFQRAALFRIAVADLTGAMPLMRVSDRLTDIAELIVARAMELGWRQITAQFGVPICGEGGARRPVNICAVGYGKLGGMELGYASDLDLVFLHDSHGERQETSGAEADRQPAVLRASGAAHRAPAHHALGRRPALRGGRAAAPERQGGPAGHEHRAFAEYQRARPGPGSTRRCCMPARWPARRSCARGSRRAPRGAVPPRAARESARRGARHARAHAARALEGRRGAFDIKQDAGGIADIEFLAQYWALPGPGVSAGGDVRRHHSPARIGGLGRSRAAGDRRRAHRAYRAYRARTHHLSLAGTAPLVPAQEFREPRAP